MSFTNDNPALLLIDIQKGLDDEEYYGGNRNNRDAETKCALLLEKWRLLKLPIFHIQHSSQNPESRLHASHPGFAIKTEVAPRSDEPVIVKNVNSAFIGTDLQRQLEKRNINTLVLVGLTTNHCVSSTARMAGNLGFRTILVSDAMATFDRIGPEGVHFDSEIIHQVTLASLHQEFAEIKSTKEVLKLL